MNKVGGRLVGVGGGWKPRWREGRKNEEWCAVIIYIEIYLWQLPASRLNESNHNSEQGRRSAFASCKRKRNKVGLYSWWYLQWKDQTYIPSLWVAVMDIGRHWKEGGINIGKRMCIVLPYQCTGGYCTSYERSKESTVVNMEKYVRLKLLESMIYCIQYRFWLIINLLLPIESTRTKTCRTFHWFPILIDSPSNFHRASVSSSNAFVASKYQILLLAKEKSLFLVFPCKGLLSLEDTPSYKLCSSR